MKYIKYQETVLVHNSYLFAIPDSVWQLLLWSHGGDGRAADEELKQWAEDGCWNEGAEPYDVDLDQCYHSEWEVDPWTDKLDREKATEYNEFDSTCFDKVEDYNYGVDLYLRCVAFYGEKQVEEMFGPYIKDRNVLVEYGVFMKNKAINHKSGWELVEEVLLFQEWYKSNKGEV